MSERQIIEYFKHVMREKAIPAARVAHELNVSEAAISLLLNHHRRLTYTMFTAICRTLGIAIELIEMVEEYE